MLLGRAPQSATTTIQSQELSEAHDPEMPWETGHLKQPAEALTETVTEIVDRNCGGFDRIVDRNHLTEILV